MTKLPKKMILVYPGPSISHFFKLVNRWILSMFFFNMLKLALSTLKCTRILYILSWRCCWPHIWKLIVNVLQTHHANNMVLFGHVAWFDWAIAVRRGRMCELGWQKGRGRRSSCRRGLACESITTNASVKL